MKYVSPQTEKRKQQKRRRRKKLLFCAVLLCVAAIAAMMFFVLGVEKDKPSSSDGVQTESTTPDRDENSSQITEDENSREEESSAASEDEKEEESTGDGSYEEKEPGKGDDSSDEEKTEKPKKKKQSLVKRIKAIFAKTEPIPVTFPATVFGRTVDAAMDEIISLSPLATEAILSSPSQNALVAVSSYCNKWGNESLMTVGTPLIPNVEKIIQLKPDCVIVQTPLSAIDKAEIEENGIVVFELDYPKDIDGIKELYRSVTAITMGADIATFESERVAADISEKLNLYTLALENQNKLNAVMLFNSFGMVATPDTMEGKLLGYFFDVKDFGGGYMAENMEAVVATNPEVLIVSADINEEQLAQLGLADTSAVHNGRVYYVDIQQFENLSLKSIKTLCGIANEVYGSIIQPPVVEETE